MCLLTQISHSCGHAGVSQTNCYNPNVLNHQMHQQVSVPGIPCQSCALQPIVDPAFQTAQYVYSGQANHPYGQPFFYPSTVPGQIPTLQYPGLAQSAPQYSMQPQVYQPQVPQGVTGPPPFQAGNVPNWVPREIRWENLSGTWHQVEHFAGMPRAPGERRGWNTEHGWDTGSLPPRNNLRPFAMPLSEIRAWVEVLIDVARSRGVDPSSWIQGAAAPLYQHHAPPHHQLQYLQPQHQHQKYIHYPTQHPPAYQQHPPNHPQQQAPNSPREAAHPSPQLVSRDPSHRRASPSSRELRPRRVSRSREPTLAPQPTLAHQLPALPEGVAEEIEDRVSEASTAVQAADLVKGSGEESSSRKRVAFMNA